MLVHMKPNGEMYRDGILIKIIIYCGLTPKMYVDLSEWMRETFG